MSTRFSRRSGLVCALLLALGPLAAQAAAIDNTSPQKLIESSSKLLLSDLDANRARYRADISALYKLIDTEFLPHVDVSYAAQQVLGRHWRTANADQRKRFIDTFYRSLQTTYGDALLDFTSNQMRVLPFQGDASADRASVRTEIRRANGAAVAVAYSLRKDAAGTWKVWDVTIEGISYVRSFREDFGVEIDQKGLEALLKRLEAGQVAVPAGLR